MEHMMKQCKSCCKDITGEELKEYNGYCQKCYEDNNNKGENQVASSIKSISILFIIIGIIGTIYVFTYNIVLAFIVGIMSIAISRFIFGYGEIIQLLEDIKNKIGGLKNE